MKTAKDKIAVLTATWFGSGLIPPVLLKGMAGTYGSLFSVPLCWLAVRLARPDGIVRFNGQDFLYVLAIVAVLLAGFWAVPLAEIAIGPRRNWQGKVRKHDQNEIVIDETLGMLIACWPLAYFAAAPRWWQYGLAFGFFRLWDITKPPGVRYFDKQDGAWGVMMDDAAAGVYAALCLVLANLAIRCLAG